MRWFKPIRSICKECGVHYEPVTGYEARWGHLCAQHRKPVKERDLRKDAVVSWASANWEKLEDMYKKEAEETKARDESCLLGLGGPHSAAQDMRNYQGVAAYRGLNTRWGMW